MNIMPDSKIIVCQDVPLDNTYEHSIHFGYARDYTSLQRQYDYFYSKRKYEFDPVTYTRTGRNTVRVEMVADNMYNCNYMMFQNSNFRTESVHYVGDKWFFAFITHVEYINNAVSEITYEIDDVQTWLFDYQCNDVFVERMHNPTDNIGDNLIPEPLTPSAFVTSAEQEYPILDPTGQAGFQRRSIMIVNKKPDTTPFSPEEALINSKFTLLDYVDGLPMMHIWYAIFNMDDSADLLKLTQVMGLYSGEEDRIIGIFAIPPMLGATVNDLSLESVYNIIPNNCYGGTFDGYTPKNNKMYTYPFNRLQVSNSFGQDKEYRFELFPNVQNDGVYFKYRAVSVPKPGMIIMPNNYAGELDGTDDILKIGEYPEGAFAGDSFQMWLHQGFIQSFASNISSWNAMMIPQSGDYVGHNIGLRTALTATLNIIAQGIMADQQGNKVYGNLDASSAIYGLDKGYSFKFKTKRPVRSQAVMIDDFFTRYGYAQNRIMKTDSYVRKHWTYIKCSDITLYGSVPADSMAHLTRIFNNGITWWVNPAEIGNYSLDNSPK